MDETNQSLQNIVCSDDSLGISKPQSTDSNSMFGDGSCGEPLMAQHLMLDFTPGDEDTEYIQKKCCAFWDFIKSYPELQSLMVVPEPISKTSSPTLCSSLTTESSSADRSTDRKDVDSRTAVSMLGFAEGKGLLDRIFEAKLPQSSCSLGTREYVYEDFHPKKVLLKKTKSVCSCGAKCTVCQNRGSSQQTLTPSTKAVQLCNMMQSFDEKHPNCYTFHPLIQRFVRMYRCAQIFSEWMTGLLALFCCQCMEVMPISRSSSRTTASYEKGSSIEIDTGRSTEHVTIDFTPGAGESDVTEKGDKEVSDQAELEAVVVSPGTKNECVKEDLPIVSVHKKKAPPIPETNKKSPTVEPSSSGKDTQSIAMM